MKQLEIDALIAEKIMGWTLVTVDYHIVNDPKDPFYRQADAGKRIKEGTLITGPNGSLMHPSQARFFSALERAGVRSVGEYWAGLDGSFKESDAWHPSSNIIDAWEVVSKMRSDGWTFHLFSDIARDDKSGWDACFQKHGTGSFEALSEATAQLAICRAAEATLQTS